MEALWALVHEGQVITHREYQRRFQVSRNTAPNHLAGLIIHRLVHRWGTRKGPPNQAM